ncbi:MAG: hypothetical protein CSA34_07430 [Desulfobulbus propionicus]|nr:MAG: hypothetical protein CSA34_07430 [Desulfobulbus propionicus]
MHTAVFHIDLEQEERLRIGLNNVTNLLKALDGAPADLVMIFNGPGAKLLVGEHIQGFLEQITALQGLGVAFKVCRNALEAAAIADNQIPSGFTVVPASIVTLIELQQKGYAYIKP